MAISPDTLKTLNDLGMKAKAVADAAKTNKISVANALDDGSPIKAAADDLTTLLTSDGQIAKLLEASEDMQNQFKSLAASHTSSNPLTGDDFQKLGVLAAGATVLSAQAFALAITPKQVFLYTMQTVWPWLLAGAKVGLVIASIAA